MIGLFDFMSDLRLKLNELSAPILAQVSWPKPRIKLPKSFYFKPIYLMINYKRRNATTYYFTRLSYMEIYIFQRKNLPEEVLLEAEWMGREAGEMRW